MLDLHFHSNYTTMSKFHPLEVVGRGSETQLRVQRWPKIKLMSVQRSIHLNVDPFSAGDAFMHLQIIYF